MSGWATVKLDDVARRGSGHTPSKGHPEYWHGPVKWVSLRDTLRLDRGLIRETASTITAAGVAHSSAVVHPAGTVVLLRDAGVGKSAILGADMAVSQHFMAWVCGPKFHNWFLYYVLQAWKPEFERIASGNTIKTIGLDYFRQFLVPLPGIDEQRAIAETLREADDLIGSLERAITKRRAIKQGMVQELLAGRTRLPGFSDAWTTRKLSAVGKFLRGRGIKRDDVRLTGVPCIRYGELYTTYTDYTVSTVSFVRAAVAATALPIRGGDILFAGSGETKEEIGMSVAYIGDKPAVAGGDIIVLRATEYDPVYLASLLNTPGVAHQKARGGQGDAVVHINWRVLAEIEVTVPALPEQHAIAEVLRDADGEIATLERRLKSARAVKTGVMQELLTGRTRLPVGAAL